MPSTLTIAGGAILAWRLSNTLDGSFGLGMLEEALTRGCPEVFNTDPGVPFTAEAWTGRLERAGKAFLFAPHALSSQCEGRAGRTRMPGDRAGR